MVAAPLNGILLVNKPAGPSSAGVVGRLKHALRQGGWPLKGPGRVAIGHGGTLDPFATGLLPIGLGKGTKALQGLLEGPKTYRFTLVFGTQTTTADLTGTPLAHSATRPTQAEIIAILPRFIGPQSQTPPAFSAMKVNGERAYARARKGEDVVLAPRTITIYSIECEEFNTENAIFSTTVSKGTYIRSLGEDMAKALGTVGHVGALCRTGHGPFRLEDAQPPEILDNAFKTGQIAPYIHLLPAPAGVESLNSEA